MNLGVFNRVNLKDSQGGMYSEWASLSTLIQQGSEESQSVLEKFPPGAGKEVALSIVRQLAANLGITQAGEPSPLSTDREVQWCMEVICFGLSLPLAEHDTVRDCVNIYCEWLSALYSTPKISVPRPIVDDPNFYARKIISHFHNLFVPRKGEVWPFLYQDLGTDTINRQAVLCHRVLRTLQQIARGPATLERETWESLLLFLIGINDALLAPPATREDAGEQLCERVLGVLLEVWLVSCERSFPSPPLWRTLRESCLRWRHRLALVEQWNRVCLALTARLLHIMYGPMFPELKISEEDTQLVQPTMSDEAVAQAWYRLLRTIGDPVDLCRPAVVSQTQAFLQYAIASPNVIDPCQHPCLQSLPQIFLKAIKGIAGQVDAFLGVSQACCWEECCVSNVTGNSGISSGGVGWDRSSSRDQPQPSPTPPTQRRLAKSFSVTPSAVTKGIPKASLIGLTTSRVSSSPPILISNSGPSSASSTASMTSLGQDIRPPLAPGRPKCNSILHLFGEWLFEAAFIGTEGWSQNLPQPSGASKRPSSVLVDGPSSLQETVSDVPSTLCIDRYESGRAEALGALCRIFCAKKTGEEILPVYLARFYQAMYHGLKVDESRECGETLASILLNSADLFRLDLNGIQVLVPAVLSALEVVLPEKDLKLKSNVVSKPDLRRASIHLLISMLTLPLHFQNLAIKELPVIPGTKCFFSEKSPVTFVQLKSRLMNLLINALQVETDPQNTHMLLGALLLSVQDSAAAEEVEQVTQPDTVASDSTTNLLSSVTSDSASQISISSDQRSIGDASDIATLQEECIAFGNTHLLFYLATYIFIKITFENIRRMRISFLMLIIYYVGYFPSACGAQSLSSLLDEVSLLRHCNSWTGGRVARQAAVERFRYFVSENAIVLALLEEPLGNDQDPQPTVTVLIRGPFGRHAWTMQLRHLPRHRSSIRSINSNPGRPLPLAEAAPQTDYKPRFFPDNVDRIPHCKVDESIPSLEAVMSDNDAVRDEHQILAQLLERQITLESKHDNGNIKTAEDKTDECIPPQICHEFQTARLFLSHFGFLNMEPKENDESRNSGLIALDPTIPGFCTELETLDNISPRTCDTVHIFYVKAGQKSASEILSNVLHDENVSPNFLEFLSSLGWPVSISAHAGWTGHVSTSWRVTAQVNVPQPAHSNHGGALYNGDTHVLYWADVSSEIAFVVPTQSYLVVSSDSLEESSYNSDISTNGQVWFERSISESTDTRSSGTSQNTTQNSRTMSLDLEKQPSSLPGAGPTNSSSADPIRPRRTMKQAVPSQTNTKIMVVWLESLEDHIQFPIGDLLPSTYTGLEQSRMLQATDVHVIFLQALANGLMRIRLQGPVSRINLATPLIDGMVVSRRVLGTLVRQTALNMGRRKRLDNDSYHPPHVRRRLKIQEMVQKYKRNLTDPELLTLLFSSTQTYQVK
ncbi:PREDICTED: LOW QUALITY PROTEIN: ral GTPase-activating protein subunit beta [Atta cephalotes]|uniref:Rap-GAP domain-containing protein n=1 Tax=Atta cephalotes TaxID=12957 RepID=A0A158NRE5_ATTCE|nr:PREDICTED: LOW QUALITY PROTEIN: ral GTPase-activating protein subunit beta [Atta cephalotes]